MISLVCSSDFNMLCVLSLFATLAITTEPRIPPDCLQCMFRKVDKQHDTDGFISLEEFILSKRPDDVSTHVIQCKDACQTLLPYAVHKMLFVAHDIASTLSCDTCLFDAADTDHNSKLDMGEFMTISNPDDSKNCQVECLLDSSHASSQNMNMVSFALRVALFGLLLTFWLTRTHQ